MIVLSKRKRQSRPSVLILEFNYNLPLGVLEKIGFGGGCHWCTEAVFQSLTGVDQVDQGWIASEGEATAFSEAVIVAYDMSKIPLKALIEIHLLTHKSTSDHSMRKKYRSAVYVFSKSQDAKVNMILESLQVEFDHALVTQVLPFIEFKPSKEEFKAYYYKNPQKPFCENFIHPKLKLLLKRFSQYTNKEKLDHLQ